MGSDRLPRTTEDLLADLPQPRRRLHSLLLLALLVIHCHRRRP